jgi:hypothetical protein
MNTDHEAQLIENRVRILKKEEEKMLKKINEARRQANKLSETRDMQNERYARMVEFRLM